MQIVLIILAVVIVGGGIALLALSPTLQKKGDAAVDKAKEILGADNVLEIEPKAVGLATEPPEAGTNGGMGVLAVSATDLVFIPWGNLEVMQVARSTITSVGCSSDEPANAVKATIILDFEHRGAQAKAQFRVSRDLVSWLTVLGYDWGPHGPPAIDAESDAGAEPDTDSNS